MTRLDMFIDRMVAQRDCLNWAADAVRDIPGPVFELGLGNGRTYDHMRSLFTDREIYVFERKIASHPSCVPPDSNLYLGEVMETLVEAEKRFGRQVAMLHTDLGSHNEEKNIIFAHKISPLLERMMCPGGIVIATDEMYVAKWKKLDLPEGVKPKWGHLYRA